MLYGYGMSENEVRGNEAAAAHVGIAASTWRAYVTRGQAPAPDLPPLISGGHAIPGWKQTTLDTWKSDRPGRGRRRAE